MAQRPVALKLGTAVGLLTVAACLAPLLAVLHVAGGISPLSAADFAALKFTLMQASLSALLSVGLAIPTARALARRRFFGRGVLITLLGAPFLMPTLVAIMGLVALFGQNGLLTHALETLHLPTFSLYGLHGVVLAHVFFNLPLATRMILQGWQAIPQERLRLALALNAPFYTVLERPMLRQTVPGALALVFLICLSSFAVALTLGGGPKATTIELALYQAVLFDFDLPRAASLGLWQLLLCLGAGALAALLTRHTAFGVGLDRKPLPLPATAISVPLDYALLTFASLLLILPVAAVLWRGLPALPFLPLEVWQAALRSTLVALGASASTLILATALALRGGWPAQLAAALPLAISSLLLGIGAFLLLYPFVTPSTLALPITLAVNSLLALPYALRQIAPAALATKRDFGRLGLALSLSPWARLRYIYLPRLRRPLGFAGGLTAALALGDLGAIALFANHETPTLPLVMQRLLGAYQTQNAAAAGVILLLLGFALFLAFDLWGRRNADL